ncbi:MAG: ribosome biogenesis GTPase YlqF [Defluviitaleaceae bacterium]|nr:ribosome biogenesis GTPase YlqF [Defluviitaleaceae bacterium]
MDIQWYPGHMAKSRKLIEESISLTDVIIELIDARIPRSSRNPDIDRMAAGRRHIVVLNKSDLADPSATSAWVGYYNGRGLCAIAADMSASKGLDKIVEAAYSLMAEKLERERRRGRVFVPIKAMITGIPNVGKSTLINRFVGKAPAKTEDRPGVTRGKQWIKLRKDFYLLDTPGILWPKFGDKETGVDLAITGAIRDNLPDMTELARILIGKLAAIKPEAIPGRYKVDAGAEKSPAEILEDIGRARGHVLKGGEADAYRTAAVLLDEFRGGKLGRITLELP